MPSPKRRRIFKADKEDDRVAVASGLRRIAESLERMEEEARIIRRMAIELSENINPSI